VPKAALQTKDIKGTGLRRTDPILSSGRVAHVLLVGLEPLLCQGIKLITQTVPDIEVIGAVATGEEALVHTVALCPDVVLTEMRLADGSGIDALRTIRHRCPDARILVLSSCDDAEIARDAMMAGALGYVLKDMTSEMLLRAIRAVLDNQTILSPLIARQLVRRLSTGPTHNDNYGNRRSGSSLRAALSANDIEVLNRVARGLSDKDIAAQLFLSKSAVKSRLRDLYRRFRLRNRAQAAVFAWEQRLRTSRSARTHNDNRLPHKPHGAVDTAPAGANGYTAVSKRRSLNEAVASSH